MFCVVDVAECATATEVFLPGGDTPEGCGCTAWMVVRQALMVVRLHGAWLVDASGCVTKECLCWCTVGCLGQHWLFLLGPAYTAALLWLVVCGVVLCENCIVDASIFLFCVLVFIPVCLCVRVFCYGRMVDALAC